jgi:serpin B
MKLKAVLSCFLLMAFMAGCSKNPGSLTSSGGETGLPFAVAKSASVQRDTAAIDQALVAAQVADLNGFAVAMYTKLINGNSNLFFCPYSIAMALAVADAGAAGATDSQIRQLLAPSMAGDDFHSAMNTLDLSLTGYAKSTPGITLSVVNSAWCQVGWDFRISYLDKISRYYGAGVNLLDFAAKPEESRLTINTWVGDQTNQKILDLLPQGSITYLTKLVLTDAIYFLGAWQHKFDTSLTKNGHFYTSGMMSDTHSVIVPLMQFGKTDSLVKVLYSQQDRYDIMEFPYANGRLTMTVVLPYYNVFSLVENALTSDYLSLIVTYPDSTNIPPVILPKFKFTTGSFSLAAPLKALGMDRAFSDSADFSGIDGRQGLYIGDVYHKAFISIDEHGTEAAAATGVVIPTVGTRPKGFCANRPFIFMIRDKQTKVILFMGRVMDPTKTG